MAKKRDEKTQAGLLLEAGEHPESDNRPNETPDRAVAPAPQTASSPDKAA